MKWFYLTAVLVLMTSTAFAGKNSQRLEALELRVDALEAAAQIPGPAGPVGPAGADGVDGATGPQGPAGSATSEPKLILVDANGFVVGDAFPEGGAINVFVSVGGHVAKCSVWDGEDQELLIVNTNVVSEEIHWTDPGCTGTPFVSLYGPPTGELPALVDAVSVDTGTYEAGAFVGDVPWLSVEVAGQGCFEASDPGLYINDVYEAVRLGPALSDGFTAPFNLEIR
ncbi:MAG: hypothetical protein V3S71_02710 [Acidobacteriota bacterium]